MESPSKSGLALVAVVAFVVSAVTTVVVSRATSGGGDESSAAMLRRVESLEREAEAARPAVRESDRAILRRIEAMETRLPSAGASSPGDSAAGAASVPSVAPEGGPSAELDKLHDEIAADLRRDPASDEHRTAVVRLAEHLVKGAGPPSVESEFDWARVLLTREARRDRVTVKDADALEPILSALPATHAARPALAACVAAGWGRDPRLGGLLSRFASNSESSLHEAVLETLDDEHPGAAFSEYVLRIVREEKDVSVLATALSLDIVEAAATASVAPRFVQTVETRVEGGGLDADTRTRCGLAIAVASLKDPPTGVTVLRRLAARETDTEIADRYGKAASELQLGTATLKSLERLFE